MIKSNIFSKFFIIVIIFTSVSCSQNFHSSMLNQSLEEKEFEEKEAIEPNNNSNSRTITLSNTNKDIVISGYLREGLGLTKQAYTTINHFNLLTSRYIDLISYSINYNNFLLELHDDIRQKVYFEFIPINDLRNLAISCADKYLANSFVNASNLGKQANICPLNIPDTIINEIYHDKYALNIFSRMYMTNSYKNLTENIRTLLFQNPEFYINSLCKINDKIILDKYEFWIKIAGWIIEDYSNKMQNTKKCDDNTISKFHNKLKRIALLLREENNKNNSEENRQRVFYFNLRLMEHKIS